MAKKVQTTINKYFGGGGPCTTHSPPRKKRCIQTKLLLYTDEDIVNSEGMDRRYKEFWNEKVKEMEDVRYRLHLPTVSSLEGSIRTSWVYKKTSYIEIEADDVQAQITRLYDKKKC